MLSMLEGLGDITDGFAVDQLRHSLQTATRAEEAGADPEMVVAALCHDIGKYVSVPNHPRIAAEILRPYVRDEVFQVILAHQDFQGRHYYHHFGGDPEARDQYRGEPWFALAEQLRRRVGPDELRPRLPDRAALALRAARPRRLRPAPASSDGGPDLTHAHHAPRRATCAATTTCAGSSWSWADRTSVAATPTADLRPRPGPHRLLPRGRQHRRRAEGRPHRGRRPGGVDPGRRRRRGRRYRGHRGRPGRLLRRAPRSTWARASPCGSATSSPTPTGQVRGHSRRRRPERPRRDPRPCWPRCSTTKPTSSSPAGGLGTDETSDEVRHGRRRVLRHGDQPLTGQHLTDTSNGYRALRIEVLRDVTLEQDQYQTAELIISAAARADGGSPSCPTVWHPRASGESKKGHNVFFGLQYARVDPAHLVARAALTCRRRRASGATVPSRLGRARAPSRPAAWSLAFTPFRAPSSACRPRSAPPGW